jgi:hypothetical protein
MQELLELQPQELEQSAAAILESKTNTCDSNKMDVDEPEKAAEDSEEG